MKRMLAIVVVVVVALAYLAGFWPQHRQLNDAQAESRRLQERLTSAEGRVRLAELLGQLLRLSDAVTARNYGEAATLSSSFFDSVRAEAARADQPAVKEALETILRTRDQVTTAIAQTDPSVSVSLKEHERTLRRALGYSVNAPS
jgi:predicted negative regulator of RcsB-dependent stress response